jgi:outer membrane receptor protein involved in Fe transport
MRISPTPRHYFWGAAVPFALLHGWAQAQQAPDGASPAPPGSGAEPAGAGRADPGVALEQVVVTASSGQLSKLRSSVAVSTLEWEQIQQSAPGNAADILRDVPGMGAAASGGEGNANIAARGLPVGGGAKLVQLQEDGLPVLEFGDIDFGTADTFLRADYNVERLEVIRGGSAATFASNAPSAVANFISKTGEVAGGNVGLTRGLGFERTRLDADYGAPLGAGWRFHVGGFYRDGEGPRSVGYRAEKGGQIKGNLTREFDNGFVRLNFKLLNDRAPVYLPEPLSITGRNADPRVASLPGFDIRSGAMQSPYFRHDLGLDKDGKPVATDVADGYYSKSRALGGEAAFKLADGWRADYKFRLASTSGRFVGPYPVELDKASTLAGAIGGPGATLRYASGPLAGQGVGNPDALAGNGLAVRTHLFNTTLNDLGNATQDLNLTKTFDSADWGRTGVTVGYYKSRQNIVEDWHWNTYLQEVRGADSALLDVFDASGKAVTQNGLVAYGEPAWGNCCVRFYDLRYDTDAPHLATSWQKGPVNLDVSVRYDIARASGRYAGSTGTLVRDVNGDGVIQVPEQSVPVVNGAWMPVDYTKRYLSYSLGGNYLLTRDLSLFARQSRGGRANAERVLFGGGIRADGGIAKQVAVNMVDQTEGGLKWRANGFSLFATVFHATTQETNQDITSATVGHFTNRDYDAKGLELEASYHLGAFTLRGGVTYTDAKIVRDDITPGDVGRRISPRLMYQFTPAYRGERFAGGLNIIGNSASPTGVMAAPGFTQVNAFLSWQMGAGNSLALSANNLFNVIGITEISNSSAGVSASGLSNARSINGRTLQATLNHAF